MSLSLLPESALGGPEDELRHLPPIPIPAGEPRPAIEERAIVWAAAGVLVGYPGEALAGVLPDVEDALRLVADRVGGAAPLLALACHLRGREPLQVQQDYVATFDTKRRCCPYLTYYLHGDTRRRGVALWRVKAALAGCGVEPAHGELPDHLAVLAELAATGDESVAVALLEEHRPGLTLLRAALEHARSPYVAVLDAVEALLPPAGPAATRASQAAAAHLASSGPPTELVGLPGHLPPFLPHADDFADQRGARR